MTAMVEALAGMFRSNDDGSISLDGQTQKNLDQARARHRVWKPGWAESLAFVEGRQFVFRSKWGGQAVLNELDVHEGGLKPSYRSRTIRNRILTYWLTKISNATSTTPDYEVMPTSPDPEIVNAARLGEKVLDYLHDHLRLREMLVEVVGYGIATGEGFIRPYWDPTSGAELPPAPYNPLNEEDTEEGPLYEGDLCIRAYGPHEVFWAAGARFEESPFHVIETAQQIEYIKALPGYMGGDLKPDAQGHGSFVQGVLSKTAARGNMAMLTEYLELPSAKNPEGRRLFICNNKVICPPEPYPMVIKGPGGYEPCILKYSYIPTPWRDRDMGLVEHLIDPQRTVNDGVNKALEWMKLALNPQILAPVGAFTKKFRPTTEPGAVIYYNPVGGKPPEWQQPPAPPQFLLEMVQNAVGDMDEIASLYQVPANLSSSRALNAYLGKVQAVEAFIVNALADFYGRLGRHLLLYVQENYTEARLLPIQGRHGLDFIDDFKGADLRDQTAVNVQPQSITPQTKEQVEQTVMNFAQLGWVDKNQAIQAIESGTTENLVEDVELDEAKQWREIQDMMGTRSEETPGGGIPQVVPWDNDAVHMYVLKNWLQTVEYEAEPDWVKAGAVNHYNAHKLQMETKQMQQVQQQSALAQSMGNQNAARPASPSPTPSLASLPQSHQ